jgi:hypothetical protein
MSGRLYLPEMMGGAVAILDYDNDGDLDVYFGQGNRLADPPPARLVFPPPAAAPLTVDTPPAAETARLRAAGEPGPPVPGAPAGAGAVPRPPQRE